MCVWCGIIKSQIKLMTDIYIRWRSDSYGKGAGYFENKREGGEVFLLSVKNEGSFTCVVKSVGCPNVIKLVKTF
jgi:hypothetical protein